MAEKIDICYFWVFYRDAAFYIYCLYPGILE